MNYVLIPGAGGAAWYWQRVQDELRRRGHDAVAPDLPAADQGAGLPEYAQAVIDAIGDRTESILVAQSMGAFTAVMVAERVPAAMLVFVNAMIPAPGETAGDWWANTGQAAARREMDLREGRDPDADFDPFVIFLHDAPPDVLDEAGDHAPSQSDTPFASPPPLQRWPDIPIRVLAATGDRFFPVEFQRRIARERLGIAPEEIPGGHLVALSHPEELADRLEAYGAELSSPAR